MVSKAISKRKEKGEIRIKDQHKPDEYWREHLTEEAFYVCRQRGSEAPYSGKLLHNKDTGLYHCTCCQSALFSSENKYESGCGWPSFDARINEQVIRFWKTLVTEWCVPKFVVQPVIATLDMF